LAAKFGLRVEKIGESTTISKWTTEVCQKIGNSLATFIRKRKEGAEAVKAW